MGRKTNTDPIDLYVGNRLYIARIMRGFSQDELGAFVGITFQSIQKYERGLMRLSASRLVRLALVLEVPPSYFFENMPVEFTNGVMTETFKSSPDMKRILEHETKELLYAYYGIDSPSERRFVKEMMLKMATQRH